MKIIILKTIAACLLLISLHSQAQSGYNNMTNHQEGNYFGEASANIGANNYGGGLKFGYYIKEFMNIRGGATYRKFAYKSYKENILEGNIEFAYTVYSPRYSDRFLHRFNVAGVAGVDYESVKVTSRANLIDPYPQYFYGHIGGELEFTATEHIGVVAHFREYYAINGSKDKLGFWRYDYGIGFRYYIWGR